MGPPDPSSLQIYPQCSHLKKVFTRTHFPYAIFFQMPYFSKKKNGFGFHRMPYFSKSRSVLRAICAWAVVPWSPHTKDLPLLVAMNPCFRLNKKRGPEMSVAQKNEFLFPCRFQSYHHIHVLYIYVYTYIHIHIHICLTGINV